MDHVSLVRRQELLSRARRQRYEWLEGCRDEALYKGTNSLRRECEYEVVDELSRDLFPCGNAILRYLDRADGGQRPLVTGDAEAERAVAAKLEAKLGATPDNATKQAPRAHDLTDSLIERLKDGELVDVVRSMQHLVSEYVSAAARSAAKSGVETEVGGLELDAEAGGEEFLCDDQEDYFAEARRRIEAFALRTASTLHKSHQPWQGRDDEARTAATIETVLYRRLEVCLFGAGCPDVDCARRASARDARLEARLRSLAFVTLDHLDADVPHESTTTKNPHWDAALCSLRDIDRAKAPSDKTARLRAAVDNLATALVREPDADALLPALVVALAQARPARLDSNLRYLRRFGKSDGAEAFLITNLLGAASFLATADHTSFNMSRQDFQDAIAMCSRAPGVQLNGSGSAQPTVASRLDEIDARRTNGSLQKSLREVSAREIRALRLARRAESVVAQASRQLDSTIRNNLDGDRTERNRQFRFLGADADHLNPANVRLLLADYHDLVAKIDCLQKGPRGK